jgi:hypothetical protein
MTSRILRIALLADGSSDRALLPIIEWTLRQHRPGLEIAQPGFRARVHAKPLQDEMTATIDIFDPDILFVHRDAENQPASQRRAEIPAIGRTLVRVVPVRMTETWLLIDAIAIRTAAGRPAGRARFDLPRVSRLEELAEFHHARVFARREDSRVVESHES